MGQRQVSILFSDVSGFTKLKPSELTIFVEKVLKSFAKIIKAKYKPLVANTWGDAIFLVFETSEEAAECALDLRDVVRNTEWSKFGILTDLSMRIGLHNAHANIVEDPITLRRNAFGDQINQAARLEPVVTPNEVFITEGFKVALQAHTPGHLVWDDVGRLPLAKGWGESQVYCLRRKNDKAFSSELRAQLTARSDSLQKRMPNALSLFSGNESAHTYASKILEHIDGFQFNPGIVRRNWAIKVVYDTGTIQTEGVITENIQWSYELINLRNEPIDYRMELLGFRNLESNADPFLFHKILENGDEVNFVPTRKKNPKAKGDKIFSTLNELIKLEPGDRIKIELRKYVNKWPASYGKDAIVHNSFAPREVSFDNRLEIEVGNNVDVGIIFGRNKLDPVGVDDIDSVGTKRHIFNIPSPILRDQAVEILLNFGLLDRQ